MTLKASAENGSSVAGRRESSCSVRVDAVDGRDVERAGEKVDDGVEERLHALVLEGGAEQDRRDGDVERRGAKRAAQHLGGHGGLVLEVGLHQLLVVVGDRVDQLVVVLVRLLHQPAISPISMFVPRSSL